MPPTIESIRLRERERGGVAVFGRAVDVGVNVGGSGSGSGRVGAEIGTSGESEVSQVIRWMSCFAWVRVRVTTRWACVLGRPLCLGLSYVAVLEIEDAERGVCWDVRPGKDAASSVEEWTGVH